MWVVGLRMLLSELKEGGPSAAGSMQKDSDIALAVAKGGGPCPRRRGALASELGRFLWERVRERVRWTATARHTSAISVISSALLMHRPPEL